MAISPRDPDCSTPDRRHWHVELPWLLPGDTDPEALAGRDAGFVSERAERKPRDLRRRGELRNRAEGDLERRHRRHRPRVVARRPQHRWAAGRRGPRDLYVMGADGSRKRTGPGRSATTRARVVTGRGADRVRVGPGRRLAVCGSSAAARGGLSRSPSQTARGRMRAPTFAPSGAIAYRSPGVAGPTSGCGSDGPSKRQPHRGAGWDHGPTGRPAARRLAFVTTGRGSRAIWLIRPTATPRPLARVEARGPTARLGRGDAAVVPRPDMLLPDLDQRAPAA